MLIKVFASGTNVQRLAKGSGRADGVIYTAYSQLEQTEDNIVNRKFYQLEVDSLKAEVEAMDEKVQPSWTKIWNKPYSNEVFISKFLRSMVGEEELRPELNLSNITGDKVDCFMLLVSAKNDPMKQIAKIAKRVIPEYHIKVLNGEFTSNRDAEYETKAEINEARNKGKKGVIIIANQMGSRSYSVSEIQATVMAYDRGSVDATVQKVSRSLTPGKTFDNEQKEFGHILDMSFDPNRSENIEKLLIDEIVMVSKSEDMDFPTATTFVLSSIDVFKTKYGTAIPVSEEDLFGLIGDNENLLKVADVTADPMACIDIIDDLAMITYEDNKTDKKTAINAVNTIREGDQIVREPTDAEKKKLTKIINDAVKKLNMSATSVYFLAGVEDNTYRKCIESISQCEERSQEFEEFIGVGTSIVETILDREILNEAILDVIVQNSKIAANSGNNAFA